MIFFLLTHSYRTVNERNRANFLSPKRKHKKKSSIFSSLAGPQLGELDSHIFRVDDSHKLVLALKLNLDSGLGLGQAGWIFDYNPTLL